MPKTLVKRCFYWLIVVMIVYIFLVNWLDIPLMYFISHDYQNSAMFTLSKILKLLFEPPVWFGLAILSFGFCWWNNKKQKFNNYNKYFLPFSINIIFAFIITFIVKFSLARYRPSELLDHNLYGFNYFTFGDNYSSTPSGHTVIAFSLFLTLAHFFKKHWVTMLCMLMPLIVAFSRLVLADHYLSDVLLSSYLGIISVYWGEWILQRWYRTWIKHS